MRLKKYPITILALLLFTIITKAQSIDCQKFKTGTFKLVHQGNETIIKRVGNFQLEYYNKDTTPLIFSVKWIGNCTYTLLPTKSTLNKNPQFPKNGVVTVNIIKVSKSSYTMRATSNFHDKVFVSEIIKLK
jgi:hypothetical protein